MLEYSFLFYSAPITAATAAVIIVGIYLFSRKKKNNTVENNTVENNTVENNIVENNIVENNTVENDTGEHHITIMGPPEVNIERKRPPIDYDKHYIIDHTTLLNFIDTKNIRRIPNPEILENLFSGGAYPNRLPIKKNYTIGYHVIEKKLWLIQPEENVFKSKEEKKKYLLEQINIQKELIEEFKVERDLAIKAKIPLEEKYYLLTTYIDASQKKFIKKREIEKQYEELDYKQLRCEQDIRDAIKEIKRLTKEYDKEEKIYQALEQFQITDYELFVYNNFNYIIFLSVLIFFSFFLVRKNFRSKK